MIWIGWALVGCGVELDADLAVEAAPPAVAVPPAVEAPTEPPEPAEAAPIKPDAAHTPPPGLIGALRSAPVARPGQVAWMCGEGDRAGFNCPMKDGRTISLCASEGAVAAEGGWAQLRVGRVDAPELSVPPSGAVAKLTHRERWTPEETERVITAQADAGVATLRLRIAEDESSGMMAPVEARLTWADAAGEQRWSCDLDASWFENADVFRELPEGG